MSRRVKVSYVVLVHNSGKALRRTLESISQQALSKEILVIDTDSKDDTIEIAKSFNAKIFNEPKGNLAIARNIGLENSNGQYIGFVDSDCVLFDGWDKRMVAYLREDNVAGVSCKWRSVGNSLVERAQDSLMPEPKDITEVNSIPTMNAMYNRKRIGDTRFDSTFSKGGEDMDFNFQLRARGFRLLLDTNNYVLHHNPKTLSELLLKYYHYGKTYMKPYMKHKKERDTNFELRRLFLATFALNFVVAMIFAPWMAIFILQLFMPFVVYINKVDSTISSSVINSMKFYAHQLGMAMGMFE